MPTSPRNRGFTFISFVATSQDLDGSLQVKEACLAVTKLHRTDLNFASKKSSLVNKLWARQLKGEGSMVKKWRVILRNLPFSVILPHSSMKLTFSQIFSIH